MKLESFKVVALFGEKDLEVIVEDNILIMIADNGAGKTTLLRLLYFFLTKQWAKLCTYEFESISANINEKNYYFERAFFINNKLSKNNYNLLAKRYSTFSNFIVNDFSKFDIAELRTKSYLIDVIEQKFDVPKSLIFTLIENLEVTRFDDSKLDWDANIIYLPTYRRIERDYDSLYGDINSRVASGILSLLPEISAKIKNEKQENKSPNSELEEQINRLFIEIIESRNNEKWVKNQSNVESLEIIEFGMSDIVFKVRLFIERNETSYLETIQEFQDLINKYFSKDKALTFDVELQLFLVHDNIKNKFFELESLSSGEKQLISIFVHLYFDEFSSFLIIDEPEISLSLYWQEMLMEDIIRKCNGLISATHSPFIVNERLKRYTAGINEFIK